VSSLPQKNDYDREIFVSAKLDDFGLDPESFRIFARINRRCGGNPNGRCYESVPSLSTSLQIGVNTVRNRLKRLADRKMIFREIRPGKTDRFGVYPSKMWLPSGHGKVSTNGIGSTKKRGYYPSRNREPVVTKSLDKGFPSSEGFPSEGISPPIENEDKAAFCDKCRDHKGRVMQVLRPDAEFSWEREGLVPCPDCNR
jgi:hypothetical protein